MVRPLPLRTEFEVARLAAHHDTSTTEVLARFTNDCGASLKQRDDGRCIFLGEGGCTVHPARPLACRLYPLGRHLAPGGDEKFAEVEPHPQTEGVYGGPGTVDDYVRSQGAEPYLAASDRYLALFRRMLLTLSRQPDAVEACDDATRIVRTAPQEADASMLDVDVMVHRWCAERGLNVPDDVAARVALHITAIEALLDEMESRNINRLR